MPPTTTSSQVLTEVLADDLLRSVGRLNRWASRHADLSVPTAQLRVLALLDELGPTRVGDLARADHITQPTLTGQVDRLERSGLVVREPDPQDSRAVVVRLLPAGAQAVRTARTARGTALAPLLDASQDSEREALREAADTLGRLVAGLPALP